MAFTYTPYQKKEYQQSQNVTDAQSALKLHQQNKPSEYQSQWQQQMNDLLSQYQNRGQFQYDVNADAMYQQMLDRYVRQGQQAMMDTMGQAAALTGGYGNSYAQTAGQQSYQNYLQGAYDMMPQFYQMALDRYQNDGDQLLNQYNLLANQEDMAYNRYMDQLNQYYAEFDRLQGVYDSERDYDYSRFQNDQAFDYGMYTDAQNMQYQLDRDATEDARYNQEWAYQQERDRIADEQWQKEFEESVRQYNEQMAWTKQQAAAKSSGGGGGGKSLVQQVREALKKGMDPKIAAQTLANMYKAGDITGKDYSDTYKKTIGNIEQNIVRVPGGGVVNGVLKTKKEK